MGRIPNWAPYAFKRLNGFFCIYKPTDLSTRKVKETIQRNLIRDLNALPCYRHERPARLYSPPVDNTMATDLAAIETTSVHVPTKLQENVKLSEHRLVLGPLFIPEDIKLSAIHSIPVKACGVLVMCIGRGRRMRNFLYDAKYMRVYHVSGRFGMATDNFSPEGRILERTTYYHINKSKLDKLCVLAQNNHQKHMFSYAGVFPDSEEAYEMASEGLVRPKDLNTPPMIYSVKCINFDLPNFTLEIHSINEDRDYLMQLVHDFGLQLKSSAVCTQVRRVRFGHFTLEHTLVKNQWDLENILNNIRMCRQLLTPEKMFSNQMIKETVSNGGLKRISSAENKQKRIVGAADIHVNDSEKVSNS